MKAFAVDKGADIYVAANPELYGDVIEVLWESVSYKDGIYNINVGPDFQMLMASFGIDLYDEEQAKLRMSESKLAAFYEWLNCPVDQGVLPESMTSWEWDAVHAAFRTERSTFMMFRCIWNIPQQMEARGFITEEDHVKAIGWLHGPAAEKGGAPANLSHPIIYVVSPTSEHPELGAYIVGFASQHYLSNEHAVTTGHTPIN